MYVYLYWLLTQKETAAAFYIFLARKAVKEEPGRNSPQIRPAVIVTAFLDEATPCLRLI